MSDRIVIGHHSIQVTRRGDYLIRYGERELTRCPTEDEARSFVAQDQAAIVQHHVEMDESKAPQDAFDQTIPDLNTRQIQWQTWRNWFYNAMTHEARNLARHQRHVANLNSGTHSYTTAEKRLTDRQTEHSNAEQFYYGPVTKCDSRIKAARRDQDSQALTTALNDAALLIIQMSHYFGSIAQPESLEALNNFMTPS